MSPDVPDRREKRRTLGWLADLYFREGGGAARRALESLAPPEALDDRCIVRHGRPALRTDTDPGDSIAYDSFCPFWDFPYSTLRVRFSARQPDRFMHHRGEELLFPVSGQVAYHFFWSPGGHQPRRVLAPPLEAGSAIRLVDSSVPHHTWSHDPEGAEAWMVIRGMGSRKSRISLELTGESDVDLTSPRGQLSEEELEDGHNFALTAWGLAESIHFHRVNAGIALKELAAACEIDPSQLSRIERADTNPSLETLLRITRCLGIDALDLIPRERDSQGLPYAVEQLPAATDGVTHSSVLCCKSVFHRLHVTHWAIPSGHEARPNQHRDPSAVHSWIVLSGSSVFELSSASGSSKELVESGGVLHCRANLCPDSVFALESTQLLQITYASQCPS